MRIDDPELWLSMELDPSVPHSADSSQLGPLLNVSYSLVTDKSSSSNNRTQRLLTASGYLPPRSNATLRIGIDFSRSSWTKRLLTQTTDTLMLKSARLFTLPAAACPG